MAAWSFDLLVKIHNMLRDELAMEPSYTTAHIKFFPRGRRQTKCLAVYWHAKPAATPHVCVLHTNHHPVTPCRVESNQGYDSVIGDLVLDGTEEEVLAEVKRAARAVLG